MLSNIYINEGKDEELVLRKEKERIRRRLY